MASIKTGLAARAASSSNSLSAPDTTALAPGYAQATIVIIPSSHARDFRLLCHRNPVSLPLVAETKPGVHDAVKSRIGHLEDDDILAHNHCDLRRDAPAYDVYIDGELKHENLQDVREHWTKDHVAFLIAANIDAETIYRSSTQLHPSGSFYMVPNAVSMRLCTTAEIGALRQQSADSAHGEPIDWGWGAVDRLGIRDVDAPLHGEAPKLADGRKLSEGAWKEEVVPVFWGSESAAALAVQEIQVPGAVMVSRPRANVVLDCREEDLKVK